MIKHPATKRRYAKYPSRTRRRGLALIEAVIAIPLVGVALVVALNTIGASNVAQTKVSDSREGYLLAQALMSEILGQEYEEPTETLAFGPEASEVGGTRAAFDDLDDYDKWSAQPPQYADGTPLVNRNEWKRKVDVAWVNISGGAILSVAETGVKKISVKVIRNAATVAMLVAFKTQGLPSLEACCYGDGTCEDLRIEECTAATGTPQGSMSNCANTACPTGTTVLFVVVDDSLLTAQELATRALIESWNYTVELINASAPQALFDAAVATADLAYVCESITAADLGAKLYAAPIGVVNEKGNMVDDNGLVSGALFWVSDTDGTISDNTHYITSPFSLGTITLVSSGQDYIYANTGIATGVQVLGTVFGSKPSLLVAESGANLIGNVPAAERRVDLFWGYQGFNPSTLTADGQTIMKRAIEWAAHEDGAVVASCGDATCDAGEECSCPADCGVPVVAEVASVTCADGLDNDCDGSTDCDDIDCAGDAACTVCGDTVCDAGEDCNSCPGDCPGVTNGKQADRYCCGNGVVETSEGDGSICDGNY